LAHRREQSEGASGPLSLKDQRILVVEDQSLIAMEIQDYLERACAIVAGPVGRVNRAVSKAEEDILDAALLDIDLDGERCWPVADVLARRTIPFAFTTGFETSIVMPERFAGRLVLLKPYREQDVLAILQKILERDHIRGSQSG
jgi:two-component system, chemotaxis family, sensor kinase Cph1